MKISQAVHRFKKLSDDLKDYKEQHEDLRKRLIKYMSSKNIQSLSFDDMVLKYSKSVKPTYILPALKDKLNKDIYNEITDKSYSISNIKKFKKLIKEYGIPTSELMKCIEITTTLNEESLNELFELGEITLEDISGCYELKSTREALSVKAGD